VEEPGKGYVAWSDIGDIAIAGRGDRVFQLDPEAGTLRFGDGVRGRVPAAGMRIRIERMRHGGGTAGNLAPNNLSAISHPNLKAIQPVATTGGEDAETLDEAEKRIPAFLRHGDRAVTAEDYKRLAADTPAVEVGRVEVLPRFVPRQRREGIPGVVSVAVLPKAPARSAPNPRPDRTMLERVHAWLDQRRPLAAELYVIGVEYVEIGLAVAVGLRSGHSRDKVLQDIRDALKDYLWPLAPGGHEGQGWALGQDVINQELEVVVARVRGVRKVTGINLFVDAGGQWKVVTANAGTGAQQLALDAWQLPELLSIVVVEDEDSVPGELKNAPAGGDGAIPIPVIPEVC
jgi:predicted phage baseplate assembly protein